MLPHTTLWPATRISIRSIAAVAAATLLRANRLTARRERGATGDLLRGLDAVPGVGSGPYNPSASRLKPVCRLPAIVAAIVLFAVPAWATTDVGTSVSIPTPASLPSSSSPQNLTVTCSINGNPATAGGGVTAILYDSTNTSIATCSGNVSNGSSTFTLTVPASTSGSGFYVKATFNGFANGTYNWTSSFGISGTFIIGHIPLTVSWPAPSAISYGTALGSAQLNATASVPGTFVYSPAGGALLNIGTTTLSVTFTATDPSYSPATQTVSIIVTKATPAGTFLSQSFSVSPHTVLASELNAIFANPSGTAVTAPTGALTYTIASAAGSGASPTSGSVVAGTVLQTGTYTIHANYPGDAKYNATSTNATFVVGAGADSGGIVWSLTPSPGDSVCKAPCGPLYIVAYIANLGTVTVTGGVNGDFSVFGPTWASCRDTCDSDRLVTYYANAHDSVNNTNLSSILNVRYYKPGPPTVPGFGPSTVTDTKIVLSCSSSPNGKFFEMKWAKAGESYGPVSSSVAELVSPNGAYFISDGSFEVNNLTQGTNYVFTMRAYSWGDTYSDWSPPVTIQTLDTEPPTGHNAPSVLITSPVGATLSWNSGTFTDNIGVVAYIVTISKNASVIFSQKTTDLSMSFNWLAPNTPYTFALYAIDAAGNQSAPGTVTGTTPADTASPPGNLTATYNTQNDCYTLHWTASSSNTSIVGYTIYVNSVPRFSVAPTALSATLGNLKAGDHIQIAAITATGLVSGLTDYQLPEGSHTAGPGSTVPVMQLTPLVPVAPPSIILEPKVVAAFGGSVSVDNHGSADYSIPLKITPGRAGLEPKLALQYNSGAGNGIAGLGWSLSTGFPGGITRGRSILARDGETRGVSFNQDKDKLYLDGKRLICTSVANDPPYGHPGSTYRTEVDSFVTVTAIADPLDNTNIGSFTVTDKSGVVMTFGKYAGTSDAYQCGVRFGPHGSTDTIGVPDPLAYAYALKFVQDTVGNTVRFTYQDLGGGEQVLSRVEYTGDSNGPGNCHVELAYTARPDQPVTFVAGAAFNHRARLAGIYAMTSVNNTDRLAACYQLKYNDPAPGEPPSVLPRRSRLVSVVPALADPQSPTFSLCPCRPVSVTWKDYSELFRSGGSIQNDPPVPVVGSRDAIITENVISWGDFDGSGKDQWAAPPWYNANEYDTILVGEFTGDGKKDKATVSCTVQNSTNATIGIGVQLSNGTQMTFEGGGAQVFQECFKDRNPDNTLMTNPTSTRLLAAEGGGAISRITVADFTGDGRDDIAVQGFDGKLHLFISHGTSFADPTATPAPDPTDSGSSATPYVGGQGDITWETSWICGTDYYCLFWVEDHYFVKAMPCDLNGDGITDYACLTYARSIDNAVEGKTTGYGSLRSFRYVISKGDGTFSAPSSLNEMFLPPERAYGDAVSVPVDTINSGVFPGDFNGDGLTDFLVLVNGTDVNVGSLYGGQRWVLYLNNGCRIFQEYPYNTPMPSFTKYNGVIPRTVKLPNEETVNTYYTPIRGTSNGALNPLDFFNNTPNNLNDPRARAFFTAFEGAAGSINNLVMDVNHDGLPDLVWYVAMDSNERNVSSLSKGWWAMLSTGRFTSNVSAPAIATSSTGFVGPVKIDFLKDEHGFDLGGGAIYDCRFGGGAITYPSINHGIDFNGDGLPDYFVEYHASGFPTSGGFRFTALDLDPVGDIVSTVTDGLGSTTSITYKVAKDDSIYTPGVPVTYPIRELRASTPVVAELSKDSGSSNPDDNAHFSYQYSGNRLDLSGRGSLGFHSFVTLDRQTNLFKYQFLTQSFPMTGLTAREETYRYLGENHFNIISSHDNTVVFDKVVKSATDSTAWGTLYPFISRAIEYRWEDGAKTFTPTGDGPSSKPEGLFGIKDRACAHIVIKAESLFDKQSSVITSLPGSLTGTLPYMPSDTDSSGASNVNIVGGVKNTVGLGNLMSALGGTITYGNLKQLKTDYDPITSPNTNTETVETSYYDPATIGGVLTLTGRPLEVKTTVVAPVGGISVTQVAPIKHYAYVTGTPLVASELNDATRADPAGSATLNLLTTYNRDSSFRITSTVISSPDPAIGAYVVSQNTTFDHRFDFATSIKNASPYEWGTDIIYNLLGLSTSVKDVMNGAEITTQYDAFGRKIHVLDVNKGLWTDTVFAWDSTQSVSAPDGFDGVAAGSGITGVTGLSLTSAYSVTTTATVQPSVVSYYDRLGRVIRTVKSGFNNQQIRTDTAYNTLGQIIAVSLPYNPADTATGPFWTKTTYDALGRVATVTAPNNTSTTNTYKGRITSSRVFASGVTWGDQTNTTLVDAKGRTVAVWNANNPAVLTAVPGSNGASCTAVPNTASVWFELDGFGRMSTTRLKGQTPAVTATYDALGHQTRLNDPDKGDWHYTNNALGQVTIQRDANDVHTTITSFDHLGRPLERTTSGDGTTETADFFYYDSGSLSNKPHTVAKGEKGWIGAPEREESVTTSAQGYTDPGTKSVHYYNAVGLPAIDLNTIDGRYFYTYTEYDGYYRVQSVRHFWRPAGHESPADQPYSWQDFGYTYTYDGSGSTSKSYLISLTDSLGRVWWDLPTYDYMDRVKTVRKGSGHWTQRTYKPEDGVVTAIKTGPSAGSMDIQNLAFAYDGLGNLTSRSGSGGSEAFEYDNLNRLTKSTVQGKPALSTAYDPNGNITAKADVSGNPVASYIYGGSRPHAVTSVTTGGATIGLDYDGNGNMVTRSGGGQTWSTKWTGFDKPRWMAKTTTSPAATAGSEFLYNANRSRVMQLEFDAMAGGVPSHYARKRIYAIGSTLEVNYDNSAPNGAPVWALKKVRIYVPGPEGVIGAREFDPAKPVSQQETALVYHYDHLGSIESITLFGSTATTYATALGGKSGRYSEDAWGKRRDPLDWQGPPTSATDDGGADSLTPRGFTGHEMLDDLGLVHMNGRIYDPLLGRMLSADLGVQFPGSLQSYNRYSYVGNNPLSFTDPTGFETEEEKRARRNKADEDWAFGTRHLSGGTIQVPDAGTGKVNTTLTPTQQGAVQKHIQQEVAKRHLKPGTKIVVPIVEDGEVVGFVTGKVQEAPSLVVQAKAESATPKGPNSAAGISGGWHLFGASSPLTATRAAELSQKYRKYLNPFGHFSTEGEAFISGALYAAAQGGFFSGNFSWADKYSDYEYIWGVRRVGTEFCSTLATTDLDSSGHVNATLNPFIMDADSKNTLMLLGHNHTLDVNMPWYLSGYEHGGFLDTQGDRALAARFGVPIVAIDPWGNSDAGNSSKDGISIKGMDLSGQDFVDFVALLRSR